MKSLHPVVSLCGLLALFLGCLVFFFLTLGCLVFHLSFMFVMLFSSWIKIYFALCLIRSQCKFGCFSCSGLCFWRMYVFFLFSFRDCPFILQLCIPSCFSFMKNLDDQKKITIQSN